MWKTYSLSYLKYNRSSGISVMVAAFISALLLSLLCSLFYNLWYYEIERIRVEEGDWQARITGEMDQDDLLLIRTYANVEKAVVNEELSTEQGTVVDLHMKHMGTILTDMPRIAALLQLPPEAVTYHHVLLNLYMIRDPADPAPRLLFPFFFAVTAMACLSLIMIIHNAFAVSMHARIHQFGIFSSIGATPGQIRTCLLQEAALLCAAPVLVGNLLGTLTGMGVIAGVNVLLADVAGRLSLPFVWHPLILLVSLLAAGLTIWISAWIPARKMSRMTPLEAIRNTGEFQLKKKKNSPVLSLLFGPEGELAGNALKAQKKALRTATFSLTASFLAFTLMICFFSLSRISQEMTYFERYQDAWDVMITVKDTQIGTFEKGGALQALSGVESGVLYQKGMAKRLVAEEELSDAFERIGGLEEAPAQYVSAREDGWMVNAPFVILDDASFLAYCEQIGAPPRLDGVVIRNTTLDTTNPNFRSRAELAYLKGDRPFTVLCHDGQEETTAQLPVLAYTREVPVLREEYGRSDVYELVHFMSVSLWETVREQIEGTEDDMYIRILAKDGVTLPELNGLEEAAAQVLGRNDGIILENRIQEKENNDAMYDGMMMVFGGFCVLLSIIGMGNVFSHTLGFVRQRKREFARYLSVGLTPAGIRKMFCVEALVIAGRPILITLPLAVGSVGVMLRLSYLEPAVFFRKAPLIPILIFIVCIFGFVALAYYLGGRQIVRCSLADALRDDTML